MPIKRILIVEDDGISAVMFSRMLEQMGYQPLPSIPSGEEAVALVRTGIAARANAALAGEEQTLLLPDLVLMDIGLDGEMDGIAAARLIRQESGLPVIYLTSYNDPVTLASVQPCLPHEYLAKPCRPEQLQAAIEMSLYQHELEKRIRSGETRYRRMVELANEGMWEIDDQYHIVFVNDKMAELLGYLPHELVGRSMEEFILPDQLDDHRRRMQERRAGLPGHYLRHFRRKDGRECIFQVSASGLFDEQGQFTGAFAIFTDITARIHESEARYQALIEASPMSVLVVQQGHYILANPAAERLLGYAPGELVGMPVMLTIHPDSHALVLQRLHNIDAGQVNSTVEMKVLRKDGQAVFTESASVAVCLAGQPAILIVSQDITARKNAEDALRKSEERLHLALSGSKTGVWEFDVFTDCFTWDLETTRQLGLPSQVTQMGRETFMAHIYPDDLARKQPRFLQALAADGEWEDEYRVIWPDGSLHWMYASGRISRDEAGRPIRILGISFDISERKRAEEKLHQALAEKGTLLKEVHHRVKNNLTTVVSLLALQSDAIQDESARHALFDSRQRVFSMALVHEELYRSDDLSHIDFGAYLSKLARRLVNIYSTNPNIELVVEVQETRLTLEKAIPIGQLVNELLTNAIKHAFPGGRAGILRVRLSSDPDTLHLSVADDGVGLPPDLDPQTASTLGMQLITVLTRQLKAVLQIRRGQVGRDQGTEFVLSVPCTGA